MADPLTNRPVNGTLFVSDSPGDLAENVAGHFAKLSGEIARLQGYCRVALPGGSTPRQFLSRLSEEPYRASVPWDDLHISWGDERCVPPDHPDSNYRMAREALLDRVPIPSRHIHRMPADQGTPSDAAASYELTLRKLFKLNGAGFPQFDVVFLGMGADGHTASLFPGSPALAEKERWVVSVPRAPNETARLTLTIPVLNNARNVLFVAQGSDKAPAVKTVLGRNSTADPLPAQLIQPSSGSTAWFLDRQAAQELESDAGSRYLRGLRP